MRVPMITDNVITICYGKKREWENREDARAFFADGVLNSEGSEQRRYATILAKLEIGMYVCSDED